MNTLIRTIVPNSKAYDRYFIAAAIVGIVVLAVLAAVNASFLARSMVLNAALDEPYKRFEAYKNGIVNYPSPEREAFLRSQSETIEAVYARLQEYPIFFDSIIKADMKGVSPLKFKEALFLLKSELRESARSQNVVLPKDIGFSEEEQALPDVEKLPDLFNALEVTRDISMRAINAGVEAIERVSPRGLEKTPSGRDEQRALYYRRIIDVDIIGEYASIARYIGSLYDSRYLLSIKVCQLTAREIKDPRESDKKDPAAQTRSGRGSKEALFARIQIEQLLF